MLGILTRYLVKDYISGDNRCYHNTHFGDNTLVKKEVGDLFLNEAVLLYEEV